MATKKQKQELIDVLKFTPTNVQLTLQGYGGESYCGTVDRKIYEHFKKNKFDLDEYASGWSDDWDSLVPPDLQPFPPGSAYECDNYFHASGAELSNLNYITITDQDGKTVWEQNLGYDELSDLGVTLECIGDYEINDLPKDTVVFWGGQGEKGCFFDAEFTLRAPFDPKKLTIFYENCDDWYLITGVHYDNEELDGCGGYSTTGKWAENKWILLNDEEVYESVPLEERDPDTDYTKFPTDEDIDAIERLVEQDLAEEKQVSDDWDPQTELEKIFKEFPNEVDKTEWFGKAVKPSIKGEYEVVIDAPWPNGGMGMAMWTGRSWKQHGNKIKIKEWRGLKFNPNEA